MVKEKEAQGLSKRSSLMHKPRLDPFGPHYWLGEKTKNQDWIYLKHNAAKPQSSLNGL